MIIKSLIKSLIKSQNDRKGQTQSNRTCFSEKTALKVVENLIVGHDQSVIDMRNNVQDVWNVSGKCLRRSAATVSGYGGYSFFSDNVGKVVIPSHNTGLLNKGQYLQMTITLVAENRISTSHMR